MEHRHGNRVWSERADNRRERRHWPGTCGALSRGGGGGAGYRAERGEAEAASDALPGLRTMVNDIGRPDEREELAAHVRRTMPTLNVLINNAGIQRRVGLAEDDAPWAVRQQEIDILLCGPVHLNHLLIPAMLAHGGAAVVANVTSGGAYVPQVFAPLYSACKAALHSYTVTLRHALAGTRVRVAEIIPPAVRTGLAGGATGHGADPDEFCDAAFAGLGDADVTEIGFGATAAPASWRPAKHMTICFPPAPAAFSWRHTRNDQTALAIRTGALARSQADRRGAAEPAGGRDRQRHFGCGLRDSLSARGKPATAACARPNCFPRSTGTRAACRISSRAWKRGSLCGAGGRGA